ncbi:DUF1707 domain-containing protein [Amycolatopsis cynarae]|uniref:DUF1707 domain-containing protein n=1 Tax=Amycolatopsis cynarae TaxID=2995223 RepID=A0ABY7B228_9PSEU|nr:DUF1707 domain-containing protein [Amycolatopsis sp. HUAS 11-8]WAL64966.1 DUF1707 domain-containing protein [Amycolatopsis sp. HUAS 11-8]
MNQVPSPEMRVSDSEREAALAALGEHMGAGRLDIDEYGERSAKVSTAKTRGELAEVFADLPEPHPTFGTPPAVTTPPAPVAATESRPREPAWADRPLNQRAVAALIPVFWGMGAVLFFTVGGWWWFLLPVLVTAVGRGLWGQEWESGQRSRRDRHRGRRDRHRP